MSATGWTKLFGTIVTSSIWVEDNATLRVWIAMLAMADANGVVVGTVPGFASLARVTIDEMRAAVQVLESPDPESRTPDHEGRRIEAIPGGWLILNYAAYRERGQAKDGSRAPYQREYRRRRREAAAALAGAGETVSPVTRNSETLRVNQKREERGKKKDQERTRQKRADGAPRVLPPHTALIEYHAERYQRIVGKKPHIDWPKASKQMTDLLASHTPETVRAALDVMFDDPDPWYRKQGFALDLFRRQFNKFLALAQTRAAGGGTVPDADETAALLRQYDADRAAAVNV